MSYISGIRPQAAEDAQENLSWCDEWSSAPRIYAYVQNDPLNLTDPLGLCDNPQGCGGGSGSIILASNEIEPDSGPVSESPQVINPAGRSAIVNIPGSTAPAENIQLIPGPGGGTAAPNFVVSPNGTAYPVPAGAQGPTPVINPAGNQTGVAFTGGSGGANGQVSTMRLMNPTPPRGNSPGYPNGYIVYQNNASPTPQLVNPLTGQTTSRALGHYPVQ